MSAERERALERLHELLADRALDALDARDAAELETLLAAHPEVDADEYERVAVELQLALVGDEDLPLSADLVRALRADAERLVGVPGEPAFAGGEPTSAGARRVDRPRGAPRFPAWLAWTGWAAAAACLILLFRTRSERPSDVPSPAERRAALVASASDLVELAWSPTEDALVADAGVRGDVVWSGARQEGYARLRNFPVNDPAVTQYQLWIFDRERPADYPVDGGVFDVPAGSEVIVPIEAKLAVAEPFLFAVTAERPGGVVVTDREHLLVLAQVPE